MLHTSYEYQDTISCMSISQTTCIRISPRVTQKSVVTIKSIALDFVVEFTTEGKDEKAHC